MDLKRIGKYKIVGELGRGTMGEVYKAHDTVLNRYVALKTLSPRVGPGDDALARFHREAQAAALLNHPNIVTVHDFGQEGGLLYMAMELLEGTDLRAAIDEDRLKTLDEKLDIMDGLLAALDYAHSRGIVHRDVKPANVHLGPEGQVKIMDFGLARVNTSEMTQDGIVLGTPNYMSPEQALGDRVDGRSDIFAAGSVLYELLTNHKPFEADSTPGVLFQVVHKEPPPVRRWAPDAPAPLVAIVERALKKDRDKRFATAAEMRSAITVARQAASAPLASSGSLPGPGGTLAKRVDTTPAPQRTGIATGPRRASHASHGGRARRGPRRGLRVLVLLLLAVAAGLGYWWWQGGRPSDFVAQRPGAGEQVGALQQALVTTQVQLAERELQDKNYAAAAAQAEGALKLAPRHPEATRLLARARERLKDLARAVREARELTDKGEIEAASQQLSRVLELDPRHPAVNELNARLNSAFQERAQQAAAALKASREQATKAGADDSKELATAKAKTSEAETLLARGAFVEATRSFLEARDAFDRAGRAAHARRAPQAAPSATPEAATASAPPVTSTPAPVAEQHPSAPPRVAATGSASSHGFRSEDTTIATPSAGGLQGFDSTDVSTQRKPEFLGRLAFEAHPAAVRAGDPFTVRVSVVNNGRRNLRVRSVAVAVVVNGQRSVLPIKPLAREVAAQAATVVAEYAGVWEEVPSWMFEAVVTFDRNETISARLRAE